ncbi:hypothetical protein WMF31_17430 [Sorangium sp. So ce1036]|uniref:hypothetical protein n=1 Tax=Sorangium sp. So ce1036 TaxID=3133328 RepID=UPI003F016182
MKRSRDAARETADPVPRPARARSARAAPSHAMSAQPCTTKATTTVHGVRP